MENLKKLYKIIRSVKWLLILVAFSALMESILALVTPWIYRLIINTVANYGSKSISLETAKQGMYNIVLYATLVFLASNSVYALTNYYALKLRVVSEKLIQMRFFEHLSLLPIEFFEKEKIGKINAKMNRGISRGGNFLMQISNWLLAQSLTGLIAMVLIFILDYKVGLIIIFGACIYLLSTFKMMKILRPMHKKINRKQDVISAQIIDVLSGMHTVRSFAQEENEVRTLGGRNQEYTQMQLNRDKIRRMFFFGRYTVMDLVRAIVIILAGFKALNGEMQVGDIMLYISYINYVVWPLNQLTMIYDEGSESMRSVEDIIKILEITPKITDKIGARDLVETDGGIEFKNVYFNYSKNKKVLERISFIVGEGSSVALVGPSGTGKTTITKLISRLYDVNKGAVLVDGVDIRDVTQKSLRQNIGVVMQDIMLFNDSIKNNIKYGTPGAKIEDIVRAAKAANIHEFIMGLPKQYNTLVGERGIKLSGGEKQRVAIARAVLKNAPILILDEATSHLDSESERLVQEALWRLIEGRTTIIIAHRLATVMQTDKILVLDKGRIIEEGNHFELIKKNGLYAKLFKLQSGAILLTDKEVKVE